MNLQSSFNLRHPHRDAAYGGAAPSRPLFNAAAATMPAHGVEATSFVQEVKDFGKNAWGAVKTGAHGVRTAASVSFLGPIKYAFGKSWDATKAVWDFGLQNIVLTGKELGKGTYHGVYGMGTPMVAGPYNDIKMNTYGQWVNMKTGLVELPKNIWETPKRYVASNRAAISNILNMPGEAYKNVKDFAITKDAKWGEKWWNFFRWPGKALKTASNIVGSTRKVVSSVLKPLALAPYLMLAQPLVPLANMPYNMAKTVVDSKLQYGHKVAEFGSASRDAAKLVLGSHERAKARMKEVRAERAARWGKKPAPAAEEHAEKPAKADKKKKKDDGHAAGGGGGHAAPAHGDGHAAPAGGDHGHAPAH